MSSTLKLVAERPVTLITAATVLPVPRPASVERARRLGRVGWAVVLGAVLPAAAWIALAPLTMAVVAPAVVKVDLNRRPVQHLEGGIVQAVLVRDGQRVRAGEPVLLLGDVGVAADRDRLTFRMQAERIGIARLEAEQALAPALALPPALAEAVRADAQLRQALQKERVLFDARRHAIVSEDALLARSRVQVEAEIAALRAEIEQARRALALQQRDLDRQQGLQTQGFISEGKLMQLQAGVADYAARLEERGSELARAQQRAIEADLKRQALRNEYVRQAADQLKTALLRLREIEQEQRKTEDAAGRQVVAAPADGEVIDLRVSSPGAVVRAGDTIAEIVPSGAPLTIEARVQPEDVDHVWRGQPARIRLLAFRYRGLPDISGHVGYVGADRLADRATGQPYYVAQVTVDAGALRAAGVPQLTAGMPVEVYLQGSTQTPLQYLLQPLTTVLRSAARQL